MRYMTTTPITCTVVLSAVEGIVCGAPAVVSFTSSRGTTYHECAAHAPASALAAPAPVAAAAHPKTATKAPYVLVAHGEIVGYAHSTSAAVVKRAARLGAKIVPVAR